MNTTLLQAAAGGSMWSSVGMIVLLIVIFYFFMIRPQSKRQKEIKKFQESLKNGSKVVTAGGIYGIVRDVKEQYLLVEIAEGVKIKINKSMVYASPEMAEQTQQEQPK